MMFVYPDEVRNLPVQQVIEDWCEWFAWRPVRLVDGTVAFYRKVQRRKVRLGAMSGGTTLTEYQPL